MPKIESIVMGEWRENCYVLHGNSRRAVVIDPGEDLEAIITCLDSRSLWVEAVINTHAHYDHVGSVADLRARYGAPFYLHAGDHRLLRQANVYRTLFGGTRNIKIPDVDFDLAQWARLELAGFDIEVIHTPGHTPGSVSFFTEGCLFSGDTIFVKKIGRTDLPGGEQGALQVSVQRLLSFPPSTTLFPGHGSSFSMADVLRTNKEAAEFLR